MFTKVAHNYNKLKIPIKNMKNKQIISPVGLKGNQILERQLSLMGIKPINENENKSNSAVELTKIGPDGNAYAIVRENHDYYIKRTDKTTGLVLEDFKYIGGLQNKKSEAYPSYAKAIKQLNLKFKSLAEAFNKGGDINVFEDDNLLTEAGIAGFSQMEGSGFSGVNNFEKSEEMYKEEVDEEETLEEEEELNEFEQAIQEMMDRESDPFGDEDEDKLGEGLDAVGHEDGDVNNDGKKDKQDDYLLNKRKEIGKNINEVFETQDELNQYMGHDDYLWYIVNRNGEIVGGNEYLLDAFDAFIEYSTNGDDANYLYLGEQSLHDIADDFLSSYGYGEPGDDLDDYDQGDLDAFISELSNQIPFAKYEDGEEVGDLFTNGFRIVKKDDGMNEVLHGGQHKIAALAGNPKEIGADDLKMARAGALNEISNKFGEFKETHPEIYSKMVANWNPKQKNPFFDSLTLDMMDWSKTMEGEDYWEAVYDGRFEDLHSSNSDINQSLNTMEESIKRLDKMITSLSEGTVKKKVVTKK